jgi:spore coat polysaccharide biosynthesis protein SpsF
MNEQEAFWAGQQGTDYFHRHYGPVGGTARDLENRQRFWSSVIDWDGAEAPVSIIEYGANIGQNLRAIRAVHRDRGMDEPAMTGVEINEEAFKILGDTAVLALNLSMLDEECSALKAEMAMTMGVLIHIAPEDLPRAYDMLHVSSERWVLIAEYYCPTVREIEYRGERQRLWARDFAGEFMDRFKDQYTLWNYGFVYRRDNDMPMDDITWFLLRKNGVADE